MSVGTNKARAVETPPLPFLLLVPCSASSHDGTLLLEGLDQGQRTTPHLAALVPGRRVEPPSVQVTAVHCLKEHSGGGVESGGHLIGPDLEAREATMFDFPAFFAP